MKVAIVIVLLAIFAVASAYRPIYGRRVRYFEPESDQSFSQSNFCRQYPDSRGCRRDDAEEEEADQFSRNGPVYYRDRATGWVSCRANCNHSSVKRWYDAVEEESDLSTWRYDRYNPYRKVCVSGRCGFDDDEEEADQRNSFGVNGNFNNGQVNVNANYGRTLNNGQVNIGGGYQTGSGFNANAGINKSWNGGNTNLQGNAQWSQNGGVNAQVGFNHKWDDEEEADSELYTWRYDRHNPYRKVCVSGRCGFDDAEEADAEFFKKVGAWLKKNLNMENIQKGMDIYRTIKGGDAEEADAEFFKKIGKALGKVGKIAQKGFDIYQQYGGLVGGARI